ncbi:MAG: hypothetical protein OEY06_09385 [Gammaproteobacteria bacterium]|nr:hypothetical protein [Gammaproteobacteria bacterium]
MKPRSGHRYDVAISYADGMYAATIHEQSTKSRARKEIENTVPRICTTQ